MRIRTNNKTNGLTANYETILNRIRHLTKNKKRASMSALNCLIEMQSLHPDHQPDTECRQQHPQQSGMQYL
jgi:hypothetical protein